MGTFLSTHKANLETPAPVFDFLGFRFDCPHLELSVKPKRREKIQNQLREIRSHFTVQFDELERLRGRLVSIALICPFSRLYTREMNRVLQVAEAHLQVIRPFYELGIPNIIFFFRPKYKSTPFYSKKS